MSIANSDAGEYPYSYYLATAKGVVEPQILAENIKADVCVIGGGYTGLSAALHLREKGHSVVLLEAQRVGWGASGRNGGQVGTGQRQDEMTLEKQFGRDTARRFWDSAEAAKSTLRDLITRHGIDCDLQSGQMVTAAKAADAPKLEARVEKLQRDYDYAQIAYLNRDQLQACLGSERYHAATLDHGAMHLHPLNYALGLARACREAGVRIFELSRVSGYTRAAPSTVTTAQGQVMADHLVVACNGYLQDLEPRVAGRIMPINNYMLATECLSNPQEIIGNGACVHDTQFVVNYFRLSADGRLLFGGGETYRQKFPADIASFVRPYMLAVFPQLAQKSIDYAWGGTLAITLSRLPHMGRLAPNLYFAHGFSGHGVATGSFAGKLMAEAIDGEHLGFDLFASLPIRPFPGGTLLRWPGLVLGMLWYALRDRL